MGIGVIIRDKMGEVLVTLSEPKEYIIAPDVTKTMATLRAVKLSSKLSFYKVVLELKVILSK